MAAIGSVLGLVIETVIFGAGLFFLMRWSSYHSYFWFMGPIVIVYGTAAAIVFHWLIAPGYYQWHPILILAVVASKAISEKEYGMKVANDFRKQSPEMADMAAVAELSTKRTVRYVWASGIAYALGFEGCIIWVHNKPVF